MKNSLRFSSIPRLAIVAFATTTIATTVATATTNPPPPTRHHQPATTNPTTEQWQEIADPGKIVPAPGEYIVVASKKALADPAWRIVVDDLRQRYSAPLVEWENDIAEAEAQIVALAPRYIAIVVKPEEADRVVVAKMHAIARRIDPDFYGDAIFGIITATDATTLARLVEKQAEPLVLERAMGTTNFDQSRFLESLLITDWKPYEFVAGKSGIVGEKTDLPAGSDTAIFFAENWGKIRPQYVLTSSHATEYNLEMPFSKGLLASCGDKFYVFPESRFESFLPLIGQTAEVEKLAREFGLSTLPDSGNPKVWIAAGNCLFGDAARDKNSMAITAISATNVRQLVGYTVPSWFGEGGWGTNSALFDGHEATSVAQAWFFANQQILARLPEKLRRAKVPLEAEGNVGVDAMVVAQIVVNCGEELTKENIGRLYDRDTVVLYGDPLFRVKFSDAATNLQPWKCKLERRGNKRRLTISGTQNKAHKGFFNFWFPEICDTTMPLKFTKISGDNNEEIAPRHALTKNFLMLEEEMELAPSEKISIEYQVKPR